MSIESFSNRVETEKRVSVNPEVGEVTGSSAADEFEIPEGIKHVYDIFKSHLDGSADLYSSIIDIEERRKNVADWVGHHVDRGSISLEEGFAVLTELEVIESEDL